MNSRRDTARELRECPTVCVSTRAYRSNEATNDHELFEPCPGWAPRREPCYSFHFKPWRPPRASPPTRRSTLATHPLVIRILLSFDAIKRRIEVIWIERSARIAKHNPQEPNAHIESRECAVGSPVAHAVAVAAFCRSRAPPTNRERAKRAAPQQNARAHSESAVCVCERRSAYPPPEYW